ncbi:MAG: glycosyltransferase [bacterium]
MNLQPLVTVNILSFNRKNELRNTLTKVYEQDYKNIEVIVVDNASSDGTSEMVESNFPQVILFKLGQNIGISGYNLGFEHAKGEFILVLDDDSYPLESTIHVAVLEFQKEINLGIIACKIINTRFNKIETESYLEYPISFIGCGAFFRKEYLVNIGYYNNLYFIYFNELELTARFYNKGYLVKYIPTCIAIHIQNINSRGTKNQNPFTSEYRFRHSFWGGAVFLLQNFYLKYSFLYLSKLVLNRFIIAVKYCYFKSFVKSLFKIFSNLYKIIRSRKVLNEEVQKLYRFGNLFALVDRDYFPSFSKPKYSSIFKLFRSD